MPLPLSASVRPRPCLRAFVDIAFGHAPGGEKAGEEAGDDGEAEGEGENGAAEADVAHAGQLVGEEFEEQFDAEVGGDKAERASAEGDDDGFAEQWLDDAGAACAQGGADGDLFAAAKVRAKMRLATLAQAMSSTKATAPSIMSRAGRTLADGLFAHGVDARRPSLCRRRDRPARGDARWCSSRPVPARA